MDKKLKDEIVKVMESTGNEDYEVILGEYAEALDNHYYIIPRERVDERALEEGKHKCLNCVIENTGTCKMNFGLRGKDNCPIDRILIVKKEGK